LVKIYFFCSFVFNLNNSNFIIMRGTYTAKAKKPVQGYEPGLSYEVHVGPVFTGKHCIFKGYKHWDEPESGYKTFPNVAELQEHFDLVPLSV